MSNISLEPLKEIAEKCVRCGICQSVCPVFAELQKETAVARGKVTLARQVLEGGMDFLPKLSTYLLQCLGCGACSENCPNGVKAEELILAMRTVMVQRKGLSLPKWLIFRKILISIHLLPWLLRTGSLLQGLILKKVPKESGLHLRFSLPYLDKDRLIPSIAKPFFIHRFPETIEGKEGSRRIGLFLGCSMNYLFPSIGEASIRLLIRNGFSVILPKNQTCCGLPAYGSGDLETSKHLGEKNIEAFDHANVDQILVPCSSCVYFLKEVYLKLFPNDQKANTFCEKIVESSDFFLNLIGQMGLDGTSHTFIPKERITYHDPCHLRRGMKVYQKPRELLKSLPGVEWVEMKQPDRCCGMGGSFNLVYYGLSRKILDRKVDHIEATKADFVVTSCMGCIIQLKDGVYQRNLKTKVVHLIEVLERKLKNDRQSSFPPPTGS